MGGAVRRGAVRVGWRGQRRARTTGRVEQLVGQAVKALEHLPPLLAWGGGGFGGQHVRGEGAQPCELGASSQHLVMVVVVVVVVVVVGGRRRRRRWW